VGRVQRSQQRRWATQDQPEYAQAAEAPQAPPSEPDVAGELEKLAKLRDEGVITAADFDAKKKQLLGI
jgi:hypothetical protein